MALIEININGKPLIESFVKWFYCITHNICPKCMGSGETRIHTKGKIGGGFPTRCERCWGRNTYFKRSEKKWTGGGISF